MFTNDEKKIDHPLARNLEIHQDLNDIAPFDVGWHVVRNELRIMKTGTGQKKSASSFTVTEQDIATIDGVLRQIDKRNAQLESFAYWKLALKVFKDFDLRFARMKDRSELAQTHRALLADLMGITELLHCFSSQIGDADLARISLSKEAVEANLKYVRSKYQQWYGLVDPQTVIAVNQAIENGANSTAGTDIQKAA